MDIDKFTSLPPSILDELYQTPIEEPKTYTEEDFFNLPVNDEYKKLNGDDKNYCDKYKHKPDVKISANSEKINNDLKSATISLDEIK